MVQPAKSALTEIGPCCTERVANQTLNIVYFEHVPRDVLEVLEWTLRQLPLVHEKEVWAPWIHQRQIKDRSRVLRFSDWFNIRIPKGSISERAMLELRKKTNSDHDRRVRWAIFTKLEKLTQGYAERTFRRKKMLGNISQAVAIFCEQRNRRFVNNPLTLEWIIRKMTNGGPFADLLYQQGLINMATCMQVASSWQARQVELQRRAAQLNRSIRKKSLTAPGARPGERSKISRSRRLDLQGDYFCPQGYTGFRVRRSYYARP